MLPVDGRLALSKPLAKGSSPSGGTLDSLTVELADAAGSLANQDLAWLREHLERAGRVLESVGSLRIRLVGDAEMAVAHAKYLGDPSPTDVITFSLAESPWPACLVDADLLVGLDEAVRQAATRGHPVRAELLLYALHGLLHCLGHDDTSDAAYDAMHAEEDRVLAAIGVGAVFARPTAGDGGREA